MTYEGKYKVKDVKAGTMNEVTVSEIKEGNLKELVGNWEKFNKQGEANPEQRAIKVVTSSKAARTVPLPEGDECHPKSIMGRWIKTYGAAPFVGQKVKTMVNADGFEDIVLAN
jgi:hypothetical protein